MMPSAPRLLRPMGLGDLLDEALALYRRNFALFAGIVAVLAVPEGIISGFLGSLTPSGTVTTSNGVSTVHWDRIVTTLWITGGSGVIGLIFTTLITGALAWAISQRYLGRETSIQEAYASIGVSTFVTLGVASILATLAEALGFILIIVPGVILIVRWLFVPEAIVLERQTLGRAFGRSWELTSGSFWRLLGYGLVILVIVGIVEATIASIFAGSLAVAGGRSVIAPVVSAVLSILIQPFQLSALVLLYYDLRIRKEGFDVEQLARTLVSPSPV